MGFRSPCLGVLAGKGQLLVEQSVQNSENRNNFTQMFVNTEIKSYFSILFKNNFQKHGGSLIDNCTIKEIVPEGPEKIKLILQNGNILNAKSIVICAGPWTSRLLEPLG